MSKKKQDRKNRISEKETRRLVKQAETYFEHVRKARNRAEKLRDTAEHIARHIGDPSGVRYDRVGTSGAGPRTDAFADALSKLEAARKRAEDAAEATENLIAEAYSICTHVMERPELDDVDAILVVLEYYVECHSLQSIATDRQCSLAAASRAKTRGLLYLQYAYFNRVAA